MVGESEASHDLGTGSRRSIGRQVQGSDARPYTVQLPSDLRCAARLFRTCACITYDAGFVYPLTRQCVLDDRVLIGLFLLHGGNPCRGLESIFTRPASIYNHNTQLCYFLTDQLITIECHYSIM